jgi:hypothetical protein
MKQKLNILSVKFESDYIIYCPFQIQKQTKFLHSLAIWPQHIKPLDLIRSDRFKKRPKLSPNQTKNGQFLPFLVQIRPKWHFRRPKIRLFSQKFS